jgi:uncharacterized damage-inducible protein DinB
MTATPDSLAVEFIVYNNWANLKLIDACTGLTAEQLASRGPGAYGSIYETLVHIVRAEAGYLRLMTGVRTPPPFAWDSHPSLAELRPYAEQIGSALLATAGHMQLSAVINDEYQGQPLHYKALTVLIQIVNHGVEHRTNVTTILAQLGLPHPDIDGWEYMMSHPERLGA